MHSKILISIIIVTFNAGKHLQHLLDSLDGKLGSLSEVIIIDGGSTDDTISVIEQNSNIIDKYISERDSGIYDAMEKGVKLAEGKYILFLGADDKLLLNLSYIENILIDDNNIYYGDVLLHPSDTVYGGRFNTARLINRNICHQSIFYPASVFKKYQFDRKYKLMADYVMNLNVWADKGYNFMYLNMLISSYSVQGLSSTNIDKEFKKDIPAIIYKKFGVYGLFVKIFNPIRNFLKF
jgi:glycosyltransferase involved in cell wall biosynthesis